MRKIIDGKSYDTGTAREVGSWDNGRFVNDFHYESETLHRKKTGEYFLHGEGGPMSRYAEARGTSSWVGGERIMPLSWDDARRWAEERLNAGEYEAEFGVAPEGDDGMVAVTVRIPSSAKAALDREASRTGRSRGDIVAGLIASLGGE